MAIPKFTEIMTPMLEWLQDGEMRHYKEFNTFIIDKLQNIRRRPSYTP